MHHIFIYCYIILERERRIPTLNTRHRQCLYNFLPLLVLFLLLPLLLPLFQRIIQAFRRLRLPIWIPCKVYNSNQWVTNPFKSPRSNCSLFKRLHYSHRYGREDTDTDRHTGPLLCYQTVMETNGMFRYSILSEIVFDLELKGSKSTVWFHSKATDESEISIAHVRTYTYDLVNDMTQCTTE